MNDLDLMRTMRADAPVPSRHRLDAGRERLLSDIASSRRRTPWPRRGLFLAGGLAAAATAAAVVATQVHPATLRTAPAAQSAKYGDPLVDRAVFGWLPAGLHANGYIADHQEEGTFQAVADGGRGSVTLTAYDPGPEPFRGYLPGGIPAKRIPADPVNGHPAYWIYRPDASGQSTFELRWQYAPKRWADLQAVGLHGGSAALTKTAYRIARTASFGGTHPIAMPLHVGGVPGGLKPKRTVLNNGAHGQVGAILDYIVKEPTSTLGVSIVKTSTIGPPAPNGTLDGHPAYQARGALWVYGVNGFTVQINASGSVLASLDKAGGLVGLFRKITIFGGDPGSWTTNPVN